MRNLVRAMGLAMLLLAAGPAGAVNCPALNSKQPGDLKDHFFVLTFFGGGPAAGAPAVKAGDLGLLKEQFKLAIVDAYDEIARQLAVEVPELNVLACDQALVDSDFSRGELGTYLNMHAIDAIWHGQEMGGPAIVYLSLPRYQRLTGATRRRAEVATLMGTSTGGTAPDPAPELARVDITQRTILALSVGLMALQIAPDDPVHLKLAKLSLCQAGANLPLLPSSVVRPEASALATDLKQVVKDALADVDQQARRIGLDLVTTQPYKRACVPF
jgi:hypothetical protein